MRHAGFIFKRFIIPVVGLSFLFLSALTASPVRANISTNTCPSQFRYLKQKLIDDGFEAAQIDRIYNHPQAQLDIKGVSLFFVHNEASLNYDQFLSQKSITNARKYMQSHQNDLIRAEKKFGVDPTVITAIILVETRLGKYVGKRSILNTLSTIASLQDSRIRKTLWDSIPASRRFTPEKFWQRADKKSRWAYNELKAFLQYTRQEKIDPTTVYGSYAGAMGIAQFMPSNILLFGRDGNKDGKINLFDHSDAIASIANFLKNYNWHPEIDRQKAYKVLLKYNYSKYYANTLLKISERLKG